MPTILSESQIKKLESDFFKSVKDKHHESTYGKVLICYHPGAYFKKRIKKECRKFIVDFAKMDDSTEDKIKDALENVSEQFVDFIKTQPTRKFDYAKDIIGNTEGAVKKSVTTAWLPIILPAWEAFYTTHLETGTRECLVPDYSSQTKQAFKDGFREIFARALPQTTTHNPNNPIRPSSHTEPSDSDSLSSSKDKGPRT